MQPGPPDDVAYLPDNRYVKAACVFLLFGSGAIALTGHGMIAIVGGIVGVLFAIEGYWGAVNYDAGAMRRFIVFMLVFIALIVTIGAIQLATVSEYCKHAGERRWQSRDEGENQQCHDTATATGTIYIIGGLTVVPVCALIMGIFYRQLLHAGKDTIAQAKRNQRAGWRRS